MKLCDIMHNKDPYLSANVQTCYYLHDPSKQQVGTLSANNDSLQCTSHGIMKPLITQNLSSFPVFHKRCQIGPFTAPFFHLFPVCQLWHLPISLSSSSYWVFQTKHSFLSFSSINRSLQDFVPPHDITRHHESPPNISSYGRSPIPLQSSVMIVSKPFNIWSLFSSIATK